MRVSVVASFLLAALGLVAVLKTGDQSQPMADHLTRALWSSMTVHAAEAADTRSAREMRGRLRITTAPISVRTLPRESVPAVTPSLGLVSKSNLIASESPLAGRMIPVTEASSLLMFGAVLIGAARIARRRFVPTRHG